MTEATVKTPIIRDCGPEGCEVDWLTSRPIETEVDDVLDFTRFAMEQDWGDGLPLIPPTVERVREFLAVGGQEHQRVMYRHRLA